MAETKNLYYVTCPICKNELMKSEFAHMEMVCPKCHNRLSIFVLGEAVFVSKKIANNKYGTYGQEVRESLTAFQGSMIRLEMSKANLSDRGR